MSELELAFYILCVAVAAGGGLAIHFLRGSEVPQAPWPIAALHGVTGVAGFGVLLLALRHGLPPSAEGIAGFGPASAALLGIALAVGLGIALAALRGRRPPGLLVAIHASLAVAAFVVLWTVVSLG